MQLTHNNTFTAANSLLLGLHKFTNFQDQFLLAFSRSSNKLSLFSINGNVLDLEKTWSGNYGNDPVLSFSEVERNIYGRFEVEVTFVSGRHAKIDWSEKYPQYARWRDGVDGEFDQCEAWEKIPQSDWAIFKEGSTITVIDTTTDQIVSSVNMNSAGWRTQNTDLDQFFVAQVGGKTYAFGASDKDNAITSFFIGAQGRVHARDILGNQDGFYTEMPKIFDLVEMAGHSYLLVGDAKTDKLFVIKVNEWGGMQLKNQISDTLHTRFDHVEDLAVMHYGDRCFVVAGGADDGLTLFEMTFDGRLHVLDVIADSQTMTLQNVKQIQGYVNGDEMVILASSESEEGLTRLTVDLSTLGMVKEGYQRDGYYTYGDKLYGTSKNDVLLGLDGSDYLYGRDGDDRLVDGKGIDYLIGGAGDDRFIFVDDARWDYVQDFEKGKDIIDLTHIHLLHDFSSLKIEKVSAKQWKIKYFEEGIDIVTTGAHISWDADDFLFY